MQNAIDKITKCDNTFYLLGDFNINISPQKKTVGNSIYINHLISSASFSVITIPTTRVTVTSSSIIDHIITNDTNHPLSTGVIYCADKLSDRYVTFCNVSVYLTKSKKYIPISVFRDKSNFNPESYCSDLNRSLLEFFDNLGELTESNFDESFDAFITVVQNVTGSHAPIKRLSRKQRKLKNKPWITKGILTSIRHKNKMHKSHYILGDQVTKSEYKKYSNKLTKIKTMAKKKHFAEELEKNKNNPKKTWEILRSLLSRKQGKIFPGSVDVNGNKITDKDAISNSFNHFFLKWLKN